MKHAVKRTPSEWVAEILAIVFLVASLVPVLFWGRLEGVEIPRHFNGAGEVDATGGRFFLILPGICSLVMCLLFRLWERYCLKRSKSDSNTTLNLWLGRWVKAIALLLVAYFGNISLAIALGWMSGLVKFVLPVVFSVLIVFIVIYLFER